MNLKEYFQKEYQGRVSFLEEVIFPIFGEELFEEGYDESLLEHNPELQPLATSTGIESIRRIGRIDLPFNPIDIFDITVTNHVHMARNRVAIQMLVRRIMDTYSGAFMIFHYSDNDDWDWRFTFCNKRNNNDDFSDSKRYTFLLGPNQSCRTAADNFDTLLKKQGNIELKDIISAFDVEALSKEFFGKYKIHYQRFVDYMCDEANGMRSDFIDTSFNSVGMTTDKVRDREEKPIRDYVKKLLGRIVFLHFLQKKGWLGVPLDKQWGEGDTNFMKHLFENSSEVQKEDFLDKVLEPLFWALDTDRTNSNDLFDTEVKFRFGTILKIPYLNGGLFEKDVLDEPDSKFPAKMFEDLFEFFYQYNFTIDENDPNDAQVGVDPEMLGRIFENLLEDNKDKGAFYTPKEIVQYMCRESLIAYLQTNIEIEEIKSNIDVFVKTYDVTILGGNNSDLAHYINEKLKNVKICDPAIGSGAFPMGLLKELFLCRGAIEEFNNAAEIKRHIIQQNIYGVDIEKGAVDIARLRFWLSLIVDEETPHSLPNLDFKIMQGNSLLESYKGIDLSGLLTKKETISNSYIISLFENETDLQRSDLAELIDDYYDCPNHTEKNEILIKIKSNVNEQLQTQGYKIDFSEIDIANNDVFFLWHTWFSDVFKKGGFDIVIGNPPYVQLQKALDDGTNRKFGDLYKGCDYESFERTGDIYCLFYEKGVRLLKQQGLLCYITSNKWMRAGYGESIRNFFATKTNPKLLIDFSGVKIFEAATVDTNILLLSKEPNQFQTICAVTSKDNKDSVKNLSVFVQQCGTINSFTLENSWVILSPIEKRIKEKIESIGTPLKNWDINIYRGVLTGCNDAFIITSSKRQEILDNCQSQDERSKTAALIRPILRGRDIKRYKADWADLWLIATFPSCNYDIEEYPTVKEYLSSVGLERLEQTGATHIVKGITVKARKKTNNKWFETQDSISYWEDFLKPKIIWKRVGSILRFSYDNNDSMALDSTCFATGNYIKYLVAILNSNMGHYMLKNAPKTGTGDLLISVQAVEPIKVPIPSEETNRYFTNLIDRKLADFSSIIDSQINHKVYEIYDLSNEEIQFIEAEYNKL